MKSPRSRSYRLFTMALVLGLILIVVLGLYRISLLFTTDWGGVFNSMGAIDYILSLALLSLLLLLRYRLN